MLDCDAKGYPKPQTKLIKLNKDCKWTYTETYFKLIFSFFNLIASQLKDYETNVIKINFTKEDAGLYKCSSSNLAGSIEKIVSIDYFGK